MTLEEFLEKLKAQGVDTGMEIDFIDFDSTRDGSLVEADIDFENNSFAVF